MVVVVSGAWLYLSADLAVWRPGAVDVDVSRSFTQGLHDFCKVRARGLGPQRNTMIPVASLGNPKWMCEKSI